MIKVLLVDDVELFLELEKSFLEELGYEVLMARSGEEALQVIAAESPALVLLDLFMTGIDGDEVCRQLRAEEKWRDLPVIMVTAAGKDEQVKRCLESGCDDYVTKPINKNILLEKVQRQLGKVRSRTAERVPVALNVQIQSGGRSMEACAKDISKNGIYVKSRNPLDAGSAVDLCLALPDGRKLNVLGKVKRVQRGAEEGMGIYFVHPESEGVAALHALINADSAKRDDTETTAVPDKAQSELADENRRLLTRINELEEENREFAEQLIEIEQVNNNLTNLYIASTKLHSELDHGRVVSIITEVVINFVGAERFALLMYDENQSQLNFETGEGFSADEFPTLSVANGLWRDVVQGGESFYREGRVVDGSDDPNAPLAAIPLQIHDRCMGVLAIYQLFVQKEKFEQVDYQLFSMMAEHAATALFSSSLYGASERKRETYKGLMDLLLK
ncbi:MAG: response regulator [Desulfuromonadales bacterium]|nr:response regulator [Desulfuromonadales bacterium]